MSNFVSTGKAVKRLGLCARTLRKYAEAGRIKYMLTEGGRYRFDVDDYIARKTVEIKDDTGAKEPEKDVA